MKKAGAGGGQVSYPLRLLAQLAEEDRQNEGARVVVGAVALGEVGDAEDRVLEDAGGIGHPGEMVELQLRQLPWPLVERLGDQGFSGARRPVPPRPLERVHVELGDVAPDHVAPQLVGVLPNGVPPGVVLQQGGHLTGDRRCIAERHQHASSVAQELGGVPVGRGDHGLAGAEGVGERSRGDLRLVERRGDVEVRGADELLEVLQLDETVVEDDVLLDPVLLRE